MQSLTRIRMLFRELPFQSNVRIAALLFGVGLNLLLTAEGRTQSSERVELIVAALDTVRSRYPSGPVVVEFLSEQTTTEDAARRLGFAARRQRAHTSVVSVDTFAVSMNLKSVKISGDTATVMVQSGARASNQRPYIETTVVTLVRRDDQWKAVMVRRNAIS